MEQPSDGERWEAVSWHRRSRAPISHEMRRVLRSAADDDAVTITAAQLRSLYYGVTERGAAVTDNELAVTYLATITSPKVGRPQLATVEVVDLGSNDYPKGFRVPVQTVVELTAYVLAEQERSAAEDDSDPSDVFVLTGSDGRRLRPEPEELLTLVQRGLGGAAIAKLYDRPVDTVNRWLREARRDHPKLPWPARRRGPAPQTPGAE